MFKLEENVTSLEDSERLAEAGIDLEADGYWCACYKQANGINALFPIHDPNEIRVLTLEQMRKLVEGDDKQFSIISSIEQAYRLDRLLVELNKSKVFKDHFSFNRDYPEENLLWWDKLKFDDDNYRSHIGFCVTKLIRCTGGQEAIKACVDLLILLKKEGCHD